MQTRQHQSLPNRLSEENAEGVTLHLEKEDELNIEYLQYNTKRTDTKSVLPISTVAIASMVYVSFENAIFDTTLLVTLVER